MVSRIIVTGNIAVGKSLVVSLFKKKGIFVIDTDSLVRGLLKKECVKRQLFHYFGDDIFSFQDVDRFILADKVFSNRNALCFLEDLLHPIVRRMVGLATRQLTKSGYSKKYYLVVVPVYVNNRYPIDGDQILLIDCDLNIQKRRLLSRNYSKQRVANILAIQNCKKVLWNLADKILLNNELSLSTLLHKIEILNCLYSV